MKTFEQKQVLLCSWHKGFETDFDIIRLISQKTCIATGIDHLKMNIESIAFRDKK